MDLELREATLSDLNRLAPLVSPFLCDPSERDTLIAMWSELVRSKSVIMPIAADVKPPFAIVHFGCVVFVSDARADEFHQLRRPFIARGLMADWAAGRNPFLNEEEIALANAGSGVNMVTMHYGGQRDDPRADIGNYESARRALRGWNLRTFTTEVTLDARRDNREWGKSLGYRVLEYSQEQLRAAGVASGHDPVIWAATRRGAEENPGYATSLLFRAFAPPRLALTRLEQRLLGLALDGATDAAIARLAGSSESAVKKHFRRLYEKARTGGVLESLAIDDGRGEQTRGVESRRHLLNYLREHPEELRPYARRASAPTGTAASASRVDLVSG
jgi:DNA-binding CsgD family transcriptional regulator